MVSTQFEEMQRHILMKSRKGRGRSSQSLYERWQLQFVLMFDYEVINIQALLNPITYLPTIMEGICYDSFAIRTKGFRAFPAMVLVYKDSFSDVHKFMSIKNRINYWFRSRQSQTIRVSLQIFGKYSLLTITRNI